MTDLCDTEEAEKHCEEALAEALKVDENNIDALQTLCNLRMIRHKDKEAKVHLDKVYQQIREIKKLNKE